MTLINPVPTSGWNENYGYDGDSGLDILEPANTPCVSATDGAIEYAELGHILLGLMTPIRDPKRSNNSRTCRLPAWSTHKPGRLSTMALNNHLGSFGSHPFNSGAPTVFPLALGVLLSTAVLPGLQPAASASPLPPVAIAPAATWRIEPKLTDKKEAENISGIACSPAPKQTCVVVSDEQTKGRYVRFATLGEKTIKPGRTLELLPPSLGTGKETEADTEAAAYASGKFYVIGSHGVAKTNPIYMPERYKLFQFPVDATNTNQIKSTNALETILASLPELKAAACGRTSTVPCRSLQDGGVNVEGLAIHEEQAWIGLRAPVAAGQGVVIQLSTKHLFNGDPGQVSLHKLALGKGQGIRDLARVNAGFLVLTGNSTPEEEKPTWPATVIFWSGDQQTTIPIATLSNTASIEKPEALLVLAEDNQNWRVLILGEGKGSIEPQEYLLPKPTP
jgi:hypothetical protein